MEEILFYNGHIYSQDDNKTWMIVKDNRIGKIGSGEIEWKGKTHNLKGNLIIPGLHDSHIHLFSVGKYSTKLSLRDVGSIAELQNELLKFANNRNQNWLIGVGWDQDQMEDKRYPSKNDIDRVVNDRPVLLYRACNHIGVFNSKALEIMGIDESTPDPLGGIIDHDDKGEPTGILREKALSLVSPYINHLDEENKLDYFRKGIKLCLESGLTSVHTNDAKAWEYYKQIENEEGLPIRIFLTIPFSEIEIENTPLPNQRYGLMECKRVKLFADGSLGAETAALREPYENSENYGILIQETNELENFIKEVKSRGYQLEIHAIGDRAAEAVIEGFENAGLAHKDRAIITHCQVLGSDLIERMKNSGYIANIQPPFGPTDARWAEKRLGQSNRQQYSYAWKTLVDSHVHVAGGSDAPIETPDPFYGMYCAIHHLGSEMRTWKEKEKMSFDEALQIYTKGGAYAVKMEDKLGQIKEGYLADFLIVNPDIMQNHDLMLENPIKEVWVDGKLRFSNILSK